MTYTILGAQWGNTEKTSAIIVSKEAGAVALSVLDTPKEWDAFVVWAKKNTVAELPVQEPRPLSKVQILENRIAALEAMIKPL